MLSFHNVNSQIHLHIHTYKKINPILYFIKLNPLFFREYIRQKNASADQGSPIDQLSGNNCQEQLSGSSSGQCSGSSGYYSSAREQQEELRLREEQMRAEAQLKSEQLHRRDRSFGSSRGEQLRLGARPANYPSSNSSYGGY